MSQILYIQQTSSTSTIPTKGSVLAAGYDLYASKDNVVKARSKALIETGISIKIPSESYGRIAPRSGLAWKNSIHVGAGVIDEDYRGNLGIVLFNLSDVDFEVKTGDRVAQLIIERITPTIIQVVDTLDDTERNQGGFGSTGQ